MNVIFAMPPENGGKMSGEGTRMIDTPNEETEVGFASIKDCRVDEASGDQYSDNVMGMLRERLTFENFSMTVHDAVNEGSEKAHVLNMLWDISFVNTATAVPPMSGPNEGETNWMVGCVKSRKSTRKLLVIEKYSGSTRLRNSTLPGVDSVKTLRAI